MRELRFGYGTVFLELCGIKRNITILILSLLMVAVLIFYAREKSWHKTVQNGLTMGCYLKLEHAIAPLARSTTPLGYDEALTETAVNKVLDDFFLESVRGNEPESLKMVVHNALAKLAIEETSQSCDRSGGAADTRETIEEAIEAELRR